MSSTKALEKDLAAIKERNKRVEMEKAWETSWTRTILISILTYLLIVIFFTFAGLPKPFLNSIVPSVAFIISTSSLSLFKRVWLKKVYK